MFKIVAVLCWILLFCSQINAREYGKIPLHLNIFTDLNGKGLEADAKILKEALENLDQIVRCYQFHDCPDEIFEADVNIFIQSIIPKVIPHARLNWFIPNPEWYCDDLSLLDFMDLVLCRTREVERIFNELNTKTFFLGFTSRDCLKKDVVKDFDLFFHLAGSSEQKGTAAILDIWERNDQLPSLILIKNGGLPLTIQSKLIVVPHTISIGELTDLQNQCGIHLCPSETEGFGHYILEAMSAGSVVVTTNAPPMNEYILDKKCLVAYTHTATLRLGTNYYVDKDRLEKTILHLTKLSKAELKRIGKKNRKMYLKKKQEFLNNLESLIDSI